MNGLCPACRRPYDEKDIEYKIITPEEQAAYKARQAQKQKKTQAALQKEKQKAEADNLSRKHLAGLRVVQKNLVYVTGLSPTSQEDQLLQTLRGDQYFGQYGKIIKIVVSKAKDPLHPHSVGVYVTYERKEDASSCITAVDGSKNGDRTLRAQFGTTKYCSAYLRGETCTNRSCMFLHEPGEANDSYSRADLSALNAGSTQHAHGRPPPPQSQQPVASATASQPMARQDSDQAPSPPPDRPALPSTASWASKPPQPSRAESRSTSGTIESPAPMHVTPASGPEPVAQAEEQGSPQPHADIAAESTVPQNTWASTRQPRSIRNRLDSPLLALLENFDVQAFRFSFALDALTQSDRETVENYPPLFEKSGGSKRRLRRQREEEQRRMEQEAQAFQQPPSVEGDDNPEMSGSLQLGGEPEEQRNLGSVQSAIQPPATGDVLDRRFQFGGFVNPGGTDRPLTPQQEQQLLQSMKASNESGSYLNNLGQLGSLQQPTSSLGHQRNASRYSFANDTSASTAVKPVANPKLLSQQSSIMPSASGNHFGAQHQHQSSQFFTSNVHGPPPGLKTTGTPPVSGGMTFGQGHGFATGGLQYGANSSRRNQNEEMYRSLLSRDTSSGVADTSAKRELHTFTPSYTNSSTPSQSFPAGPPSYASLSSFSGEEKQRKKKGKKHRHGNTSSSSGAGLVDLTSGDHSFLQARYQQAGGSGGGAASVGNGLYSVMHGSGYNGGRW